MYVLAAQLTSSDIDRLGEACQRNRLRLELGHRPDSGRLRDDVLAVFYSAGGSPLGEQEIHRRGAYSVLVRQEPSAQGIIEALRAGYSFVLASPLGVDRLTSFLGYLRSVAAPPRARILDLDEANILSTASESTTLDAAEAAALRLFGARAGRIVSREELTDTVGQDPRHITASLREKFDQIGTGAQILNVPHMGFRLVGELRLPADR